MTRTDQLLEALRRVEENASYPGPGPADRVERCRFCDAEMSAGHEPDCVMLAVQAALENNGRATA